MYVSVLCTNHPIIEQVSLTLLHGLKTANEVAFDNLIRWNSLQWAAKGDVLEFARADHDNTVITRRRASVLGTVIQRPETGTYVCLCI